MVNKESQFQADQLKPFIGATIVDVVISNDEENFVALVVEKNKKQTLLWIQRDPEANGPGCLMPQPVE